MHSTLLAGLHLSLVNRLYHNGERRQYDLPFHYPRNSYGKKGWQGIGTMSFLSQIKIIKVRLFFWNKNFQQRGGKWTNGVLTFVLIQDDSFCICCYESNFFVPLHSLVLWRTDYSCFSDSYISRQWDFWLTYIVKDSD